MIRPARSTHAVALAVALFAIPVTAVTLAASASANEPAVYTENATAPALNGYDAVGYFEGGKPVEGNPKISATYKGVKWYFASEVHKAKFNAEPSRYAPQYGGYCAYAVSQGHTASADPTTGRVIDGKLYVNYSPAVAQLWSADTPGYISKANQNWPSVLAK